MLLGHVGDGVKNRAEIRDNRTISGEKQVESNLFRSMPVAIESNREKQADNVGKSSRIIRLGPGECPDPETGARFFAALAFPAMSEERARFDAVQGWVGMYLHEANRVDETDRPFEDRTLNAFAELPLAWCKAKVRTAHRRLRDRSDAARAVRPWVRDLLDNPHPPIPGVNKFTQRQIALYVCGGDPERAANFQQRVWRKSRPVIHIAVACNLLLSTVGGEQRQFGVDLASAAVIGELVAKAKSLESLITADPRFGIDESEMLRLVWVP